MENIEGTPISMLRNNYVNNEEIQHNYINNDEMQNNYRNDEIQNNYRNDTQNNYINEVQNNYRNDVTDDIGKNKIKDLALDINKDLEEKENINNNTEESILSDTENNKSNNEKYIKHFLYEPLLLLIIYLIFSQDFVRKFIANYISYLNPKSDGTISIIGVIIYGIILVTIYTLSKKIIL